MHTNDVGILVIAAALIACLGAAGYQLRRGRRDADLAFHVQTGLTLTYFTLVPEVYAEARSLRWLTVLVSGAVLGLWGLSLWCRRRTRALSRAGKRWPASATTGETSGPVGAGHLAEPAGGHPRPAGETPMTGTGPDAQAAEQHAPRHAHGHPVGAVHR